MADPGLAQRLKSRLVEIQALLLTQRGVRLLLRAAWLFVGGNLIGWSLHSLFLSPPWWGWLLLGILLATPAFAAIFRPLPASRLAWKMDRRLGLREQISTALQSADRQETSPIARSLIADTARLLPQQAPRILRRGWFLGRDLLSALIILILLVTVFWADRYSRTLSAAEPGDPVALPPVVEDPDAQDVFPSGVPGLTSQPQDAGPDPSAGSSGGPGDLGALDDILSALGEALSEQAETAGAGDALQQGNLDQAAQEFENLADQAGQLPPEAEQNLQEALEDASQQAGSAGFDQLAEDLGNAADALEDPAANGARAADALDQIAEDLRDLSQQLANPGGQPGQQAQDPTGDEAASGEGSGTSGAGTGDGGEPPPGEPLSRIQAEGGDFELEGGQEPSGLLRPGTPGGESGPGSGSPAASSAGVAQDAGTIDTILTPYSYSWRWRDVVSEYFTPPR